MNIRVASPPFAENGVALAPPIKQYAAIDQCADINYNGASCNKKQSTLRARLDTEDTLRMNNIKIPDTLLDEEDNPFLECHQDYQKNDLNSPLPLKSRKEINGADGTKDAEEVEALVDCSSTISSLSSGSFKRPPLPHPQQTQWKRTAATPRTGAAVGHSPLPTPRTTPAMGEHNNNPEGSRAKFVPPREICFRVETSIPDWLQDDEERSQSYSHSYCSHSFSQRPSYEDDNTAENHLQECRQRKGMPKLPYHLGYKDQQQQKPQQHAPKETPLSPVWTGMPSPAHPRPTLGRFRSAPPATGTFPVRTPRATPNSNSVEQQWLNQQHPQPGKAFPYSPVVTPSTINTVTPQPQQHQQLQSCSSQEWSSTPRSALLAIPVLRRRNTTNATPMPLIVTSSPVKAHRRNPSLQSDMGGSYLDLTDPTLETSTSTNHSVILANLSWASPSPKRSQMLQELKTMLGKVVKKGAEDTDLHRSNGCLT